LATEKRENLRRCLGITLAVVMVLAGAIGWHYRFDPWGYYWKVSPAEAAVRNRVVKTAQGYHGFHEADGSHSKIIDLYNSQEKLPQDYLVKYSDSWCAAFVTAVSMRASVTQVIPAECSCQRQIGLFQDLGRWEERDDYIPLPGDIIYYDWDQTAWGDAAGWSDHVGLVVGVKWPFIKVIEGNYDDAVAYRILPIGQKHIRGFGRPDYASLVR